MKKILIAFIFLFFISFAYAQQQSLGTFQVGNNISLLQIANASYCNITSLLYPNGSIALTNVVMTKNGLNFNYTLYSQYTSTIGRYIVNGECDTVPWAYDFTLNRSGIELNEGQTKIINMLMIIIFASSVLLFAVGLLINSVPLKVIFIFSASIMFIISVLYGLVISEQTIAEYGIITEGFATFWFVIKILLGIAVLGLVIFAMVLAWNSWQVKRGYRD